MAVDSTLYSWQEQVDAAHTAVVIIDMQNDFVHPDGWVAKQRVPGFLDDTGLTSALEHCSVLVAAARASEIPVVFVRMIGDDRYLGGPLRALYARNHGHVRPTCVAEGTWGADFYGDLRPNERACEYTLDKHRYSAFTGTRLDQLLRENGVKTIVVGGEATSGCVESTVRDAFMMDYYVILAADACGDYERGRHDASLSKMALSFGTVVDVGDVIKVWAAEPAIAGHP